MTQVFNRLSWQRLDLAAKIRVLIVAQVILLAAVALLLLLVQNNVTSQINTINESITQSTLNVAGLQASETTLSRFEQRVITEYTAPGYDPAADGFNRQYDDAVEDIRDRLAELDETLVGSAEGSDSAAIEATIGAMSNTLTDRRLTFRAMVDVTTSLSNPSDGLIVQLEEAGNAFGRAAVLQSAEVTSSATESTIVERAVEIRTLERRLIQTPTEENLTLLFDSVEDLETLVSRLPTIRRIDSFPEAAAAYKASAQAFFDESTNLTNLTATLEEERSAFRQQFDTLRNQNETQALNLSNSIGSVTQRGQTVLLVGLILTLTVSSLLTFFFGRSVQNSLNPLVDAASQLEVGDLSARADVIGADEFARLASNFNSMATQLEGLVGNLEQRVAERTRDLTITADIGRAVTANRTPEALLDEVVELIRQRFGFYHAQVFIVDEQRVNANLVASTGPAGRELLSRRHALQVGSQSVIGRVTDLGKPVIAVDTSQDPVHRRNELLPDTRSEMALPMRIGDRIIGALDVQSVSANAFNEDSIAVFQIMADQLAIALENARLYTELQELREVITRAERESTQEAWRAYRRSTEGSAGGFAYERGSIGPLEPEGVSPLMKDAIAEQRVVRHERDGEAELAIPIVVREQVVGAFTFEGQNIAALGEDELSLIEAVMTRVSLALDNIRLVEETSRRAEYEQVVNEITAKIVGQTDMNYILQTTVQELGRVLRSPRTSVQLNREGEE